MLTRHVSRELSLQSLFNLDSRLSINEAIDLDIAIDIYTNILRSLYKDKTTGDDEFSAQIFFGVIENIKTIDEIIIESTSSWGIEKTAVIDRNILRQAIFEMLFSQSDVPARVVINEAIELAKTFGHKKSFKFISGVLGNIYEASGIKEKDDKLEQEKQDVEYETAAVEGKVGAMIYSVEDGEIYLAFLRNMFGFWTLAKGSIDDDSLPIKESVKNKIKQKIGIDIEVFEKIGENIYRDRGENKVPINKKAVYFLAKADHVPLVLEEGNKGLKEVKWVKMVDLKKLKTYEELDIIFNKGIEIIKKSNE